MIIDVILILILAVAPAIILHEIAHGLVAYWMGDATAKDVGRLTLNPIKHIDPIGSVVIPGILFLVHSPFLFGWAKPVPVNFRNLKNIRLGLILVAMAGPLTNIILAYGYILIYKYGILAGLSQIWQWAIMFNLILCVFNLIPIPPLDGSRVLMGIMPKQFNIYYSRLEPFGFIIVLVLLQLNVLNFMTPVIKLLAALLGIEL